MMLRDWRQADASVVRQCYEREQRSWQDDLGWDTTWTWATVEQARISWGLPGLLACDDDGTVHGWAFSMPDGARLHIGGLVAASPSLTEALLDHMIAHPAAGGGLACFIRDRAPGLVNALTCRGFEVERFLYLARPLTAEDARLVAGFASPSRGWTDRDFAAAVALLQASYSSEAGRHFAASGAAAEWAKYLSGVVQQAGCGIIDRAATRVHLECGGLQALALVTAIHPQTAHLAQLAVHPDLRGCGVGARLVREALACAASTGKTAMTLLVGEHNQRARRLYDSLGFEERATFVAARMTKRPAVQVLEPRDRQLVAGTI